MEFQSAGHWGPIWATVLLAQLLHALQVQVAVETGVETFDVSLELLWRYLPEMVQRAAAQGTDLAQAMAEVGVAIKLILPSTRIHRSVPQHRLAQIIPPPVDLVWIRQPRLLTDDTPFEVSLIVRVACWSLIVI